MNRIAYITQAELDRLKRDQLALFEPSVAISEQFRPGLIGSITTDYYLVPDVDPRAGTIKSLGPR